VSVVESLRITPAEVVDQATRDSIASRVLVIVDGEHQRFYIYEQTAQGIVATTDEPIVGFEAPLTGDRYMRSTVTLADGRTLDLSSPGGCSACGNRLAAWHPPGATSGRVLR